MNIGVDVGGTSIKLGVVNPAEQIVFRDQRLSPREPAKMVEALAEMIGVARKYYPHAPVGISCAGEIKAGGVITANQLGWVNVPIGEMLEKAVGEPLPLLNDGVCALMAETRAGALQNVHTGIMLTIGTGIGGGVVVDGKPYFGHNGATSELGHMPTHADGDRCSCGQYGCWEMYASASALSRMADGMPVKKILTTISNGGMKDLWKRYIFELTTGMIGLMSIFKPDIIVLGGGVSNAGDILVRSVRAALDAMPAYHQYYSYTRVETAHFQNDAGILGAAALVEDV